MSGKTNILVNQESRESYGKEAAEESTAISQGDDEFDGTDKEFEEARVEDNPFDAARSEESGVGALLQRAWNLSGHATGAVNEREEEEEEENAAENRKQPARNPVGGCHG